MTRRQKFAVRRLLRAVKSYNCSIRPSRIIKCEVDRFEVSRRVMVSGVIKDVGNGHFETYFLFVVGPRGGLIKEVVRRYA